MAVAEAARFESRLSVARKLLELRLDRVGSWWKLLRMIEHGMCWKQLWCQPPRSGFCVLWWLARTAVAPPPGETVKPCIRNLWGLISATCAGGFSLSTSIPSSSSYSSSSNSRIYPCKSLGHSQ